MTSPTTTAEPRGGRAGGKAALLGSVMIILGIICMVLPKATGTASAVYVGLLLGLSGLVEAFSGVRDRGQQRRGLLLGGGMLSVVIGLLLVARPSAGMTALTLLLAGFFLATGLPALVLSLLDRYPGWGWDFVFGLAVVILGIVTIWSWPKLAFWIGSTLVGIEIIIRGATMVGSGFASDAAVRPRTRAV